jgi:hypothetical protein
MTPSRSVVKVNDMTAEEKKRVWQCHFETEQARAKQTLRRKRSRLQAFLEGMGSVLDIYPAARPRVNRAVKIEVTRHGKVIVITDCPFERVTANEALAQDLENIGGDFWAAIRSATHEKEEAGHEPVRTW